MRILGIETSCDETSAAVVCDGKILSNVVSSQVDLHVAYGGVVPEVASRQHLRLIDAVIREAMDRAMISAGELDAITVTRGPGLPSSLLVGVAAARGLSLRLNKPLIPIHHIEAHLYSPQLEPAPFVALIVSGGHTLLVHVRKWGEHRVLGRTMDDAAGESFDKAAQLIGLSYPGGPEIEREARKGNPRAFDFPRPMLHSKDWNFSFSGLKTAVRYTVASLKSEVRIGRPQSPHKSAIQIPQSSSSAVASAKAEVLSPQPLALSPQQVADLSASFQAAAIEVLVKKTMRAAKACQARQIAVSGGVACNMSLRAEFERQCRTEGIRLAFAERTLCTDNAAMIALLGERKMSHGFEIPSADWDIEPDWILT